jgi:UDP:flavonoid glycosyltransferase YjiC (YdhE family)
LQPFRALHVLLPTLGSVGDVHPFIALGFALKARGHRTTILTNPFFQTLIEAQGLNLLAVGTAEQAAVAIGKSIPESRYRARRVAKVINSTLRDRESVQLRRQYVPRIDSRDALSRACELIEGLAPQ